MKLEKVVFINFFCFFLFSCMSTVNHKIFISKPLKVGSTVKPMKINGCYYRFGVDTIANKPSFFFQYFIFYENNIAVDGGIRSSSKFDDHPDSIIKYINHNISADQKESGIEFGGFNIVNKKITIQLLRYIPQFTWSPITFNGEITDNKTLHIINIEFPDWKGDLSSNFYLKFLEMTKPDSLIGNRWKNKRWYWQE